ncbi:pilin isopeptide linkage domain protein [Staphylococcus caprae]|nr:FctA domain-containing protein [Staphylococcus caprae]BBD91104.1 pilin isopeptide linkage domain protein [Staphylococcus caprae]
MKLKTKYRFSIRKFSIGTGSVLLGAFLFVGFQDVAHADEIHNNTSLQLGDTTSKPQPLENEVTKSSNSEISTQTPTTNTTQSENTSNTKETDSHITSEKPKQITDNTNAQTTASSSTTNKQKVHTRVRRSATSPITSEGVLTDHATIATPNMDNPNGATVKNREVVTPQPKNSNTTPTPNVVFEANPDPNQYTIAITDLTNFNTTYHTKYYYRLSKPYDDSDDITIQLVDGVNNSIVETKSINADGVVTFGENSLAHVVATQDPNKAKYTLLDFTFLHTLNQFKQTVPAIKVQFKSDKNGNLGNQRTSLRIFDVYNSANEGNTSPDPQYFIPITASLTTHYRVINKNNPTFQADKNDINTQTYEPDHTEQELAHYTIQGMGGQTYTASNVRRFKGYKLYQTVSPDNMSGTLISAYPVGLRYVDATNSNGGIKRIKEVVGEDGTTRVEIWTLSIDHMSEAAKSTGIDTTNYVRVYAETLKPGERNMEHLGEYIDIPGYPKPFKIQPASEGDAAGMLFAPKQVINGVQVGSGGNFRLQNFLARIKPADYYYTTLDPVEVTLKVHNIIKGDHNQTPGEFTFNIEAGPHSPTIPDASQSKTNAEDGSVTFDKIAFTKPGTYTYTITENKTNLNPNYDAEPLRVTATITVIEEDEMLKANVVYSYDGDNDGNQAFTNYYVEPQPFDLNIPFTKSLTGRNLKDGEFHFALKNDKEEVLATGVNDAQGAINFTFLDGKRPTYTNADVGHTFKYNVEEVPSNEERMTSDPMKAVISVNVLKFENTELHALTVTSIAPLDTEFNNTYTPLPATAKLEFTNVLDGKPLTDGEFQFTLSEGDHVLQTVSNQNGKVTFDHLTYNSVGSHTYTVKEVPGTDTNIDYDPMAATVTVNVTKDPVTGNYEATIVNPNDTEFNNYFVSPIALSFDFSKKLLNRPLKADEFEFTLKNEQGVEVARTKNTIDGKVIFNNISFKNSDVGTHTYTVEELQGNDPNITYDNMKAIVKISISKEGHILQSKTELPTDTEFNNTYIPLPATAKLEFNNVLLTGKPLTDGEFQFTLSEGDHVLQTATNQNGKVTFDHLTYNSEGSHTYTVKEVPGTDTNIDYDSAVATVTVNVTKNPITGNYEAVIVNPDDTKFTNYYVNPIALSFDFSKELLGRPLKADEFDFVLKNEQGKEVARTKNTVDGKVIFNNITFKNSDVGTHTYTVEELQRNNPNITYDSMKANVKISITKEGHILISKTELPADTEFNNTYIPLPAIAKLVFNNVLTGKPLTNGEFQFTLSEGDHVLQTVSNQNGKVIFDHLTYDSEGSHTYTIKELQGTDTNIDYDPMVATVTVNVVKNHLSGNYEAVIVNPNDTEFNNYYVSPVSLSLDFSKKLIGRPLKAHEFDFVLKDEQGKEVARTKNTIDGKVIFNNLTFENNDIGTYTYTIEELQGNDSNITYDHMKAKVKITITKEGHILISKTELPADIEFNNTFTPVKTPTPNKVPLPKPQKTSEHKVEYDKKAKYNKEIELMKETKFNKYNEVHKVASLPDTGISDKNNDKTLFATVFTVLGSLILLGRRRRKSKSI